MEDIKYFDLCLIEVDETPGLVEVPCGKAEKGDLVLVESEQIGKVLCKCFTHSDGDAYELATSVVPMYEVIQVFNAGWKKEGAE